MGRRAPTRILALATFAVLLVGTVAAFGAVLDLKRTGTIFDRLEVNRQFSPNGDGFKDEARVSFRITRPDVGDVEILDSEDHVVGTLARDMPLRDYFIHEFTWNGFDEEGKPLPVGLYRIRVRLRDQDRTITPPTTIELLNPDVKG
jgi:hypothetical protein